MAGTVLDIGRFRRKFPMYDDMSDTELIQKLNRKYSQDEAEVREDSSHFPHGWNQQARHLPDTAKGQGW